MRVDVLINFVLSLIRYVLNLVIKMDGLWLVLNVVDIVNIINLRAFFVQILVFV